MLDPLDHATSPNAAADPERDTRSAEPSLAERTDRVARIAARHAVAVDRDGRFPDEALAAMKSEALLGIMVPRALGGEGVAITGVVDVCYRLGRACASAAMIYAMHQTKVACVVRHGRGSAWQEALMRRLAAEQLLFASSTTEGTNGGNVRATASAITRQGDRIAFRRDASVMSYGAQADAVVTTARRAEDAAASDQVLAVFLKEDYALDVKGGWDTLGMRGTCSAGFDLQASGHADQILPVPYAAIHAETMTPTAHLVWSAVWAGIAAAATERAQAFARKAARGAGGQMPPGAPHVTRAVASLGTLRGLIGSTARRYEAMLAGDGAALAAFDFQSAITLLKVEASEAAVAIVLAAMRACGLAGYRNDGDASIGRHLRDVLSSPLMISNDRILQSLASSALLTPVPASLLA